MISVIVFLLIPKTHGSKYRGLDFKKSPKELKVQLIALGSFKNYSLNVYYSSFINGIKILKVTEEAGFHVSFRKTRDHNQNNVKL